MKGFSELESGFEDSGGAVQGASEAFDFRHGTAAITGLEGFGQRRQNERLVCWPRCVDKVLEPGATGEASRVKERSLNFYERPVDALDSRPISGLYCLTRRLQSCTTIFLPTPRRLASLHEVKLNLSFARCALRLIQIDLNLPRVSSIIERDVIAFGQSQSGD